MGTQLVAGAGQEGGVVGVSWLGGVSGQGGVAGQLGLDRGQQVLGQASRTRAQAHRELVRHLNSSTVVDTRHFIYNIYIFVISIIYHCGDLIGFIAGQPGDIGKLPEFGTNQD